MMDNWIDDLARMLGEEPLTSAEMTQLLDAARDVAHQVERKMAPVSTFVVGFAVGCQVANGADRTETLRAVLNQLNAALPGEEPEG
jgi:hypothetical protein